MDINLTGIAKTNGSQPTFSTKGPALTGNRYGAQTPTATVTDTPKTTKKLEIIGEWVEGGRIKIRTNGYYNFGNLGPNLICYLDVNRMPLGQQTTLSAIKFGSQVTSSYYGGTNRFLVENTESGINGKGVVSGSLTSDLNSTDSAIMWCYHAPHTHNFEHHLMSMREANLLAARDYLAGITGPVGTRTWQQKPIWNMANGHYGGVDTNLFCGGFNWSVANGQGSIFIKPDAVISNSLVATYWPHANASLVANNAADTLCTEPVGVNYIFNQYAANELSKGYVDLQWFTERKGTWTSAKIENLQLCVPSGPVRVVDSFSWPGFTRGFNYPLGMHKHDLVIYKTNGPGATAHVILSNTNDFKTAGKRYFQEIISWSNYEIELEVHGGYFNLQDLSNVFLNIVNSDYEQVLAKPLGA